ncbi:hypothetical protein D3C87_2123950 [compost metagenome]
MVLSVPVRSGYLILSSLTFSRLPSSGCSVSTSGPALSRKWSRDDQAICPSAPSITHSPAQGVTGPEFIQLAR